MAAYGAVRGEVTAFPAHTIGASIVDANGHSFRLNCVNWSGAELSGYVPQGLNLQPATTIIGEIVSLGYNCVRLPWSNQMWDTDPPVSGNDILANPQFDGLHAKEIFEDIVHDLADAGLMIILDNHESQAGNCCNNTDSDASWYDPGSSTYTSANWIADWKSVVATFDDIPQVIGVDLRNEPRGPHVTWGPDSSVSPDYDWHAAAEAGGDAVQSVDPNMLVFVEGVNFALDLSGVASLPVTLKVADHVVYEFHDYSFDFGTITSYDDLMSKIQNDWGYLYQKVPLWLGEFGCNGLAGINTDSCSSSNGSLGSWFGPLAKYLYYHNTAWAYWLLNGTPAPATSGSYGILNSGWDGVYSQNLQDTLSAVQPRCPASAIPDGTYYITNLDTGDVIDVPRSSTTEGTDLDEWPLNDGTNQQWVVHGLGCSLYEITNVATGQSIDVSGQSASSGAKIDEWDYWGGGNQQFVLQDDSHGDGACTISAINSMPATTGSAATGVSYGPLAVPYPIEVPGGSTTAGTLLDQAAVTGSSGQDWTFTNVSTGSTVTC
jgi:endoglucanase